MHSHSFIHAASQHCSEQWSEIVLIIYQTSSQSYIYTLVSISLSIGMEAFLPGACYSQSIKKEVCCTQRGFGFTGLTKTW